jgi:hypothetical protein
MVKPCTLLCVLLCAGGEFSTVTDQVLPGSLRAYLECRLAAEEEGQAGQAVGSYYHEGFKRKVYTQETVGTVLFVACLEQVT